MTESAAVWIGMVCLMLIDQNQTHTRETQNIHGDKLGGRATGLMLAAAFGRFDDNGRKRQRIRLFRRWCAPVNHDTLRRRKEEG